MAMQVAADLLDRLVAADAKIVFAESCTGGMVACEMTKLAGVSSVFCGSSVSYRDNTKQSWLGVDGETILSLTATSAAVAHQMAAGVLSQTPEASLAVAVTGHLGPDAPPELDGCVFIATAKKLKGKTIVNVTKHQLTGGTRIDRQTEATGLVLQTALQATDRLSQPSPR